jgi:hypothetical protein
MLPLCSWAISIAWLPGGLPQGVTITRQVAGSQTDYFIASYTPNNSNNHSYYALIPNSAADSSPGNVDFYGSVGVGTTSPSNKLDVNGAIGLTTTTATLPEAFLHVRSAMSASP